jgi:dihydrolipoamide dehydrogenase
VIAGKQHYFDVRCIPNVAYTDPEVAWVGLMEKEAKEQGYEVGTGIFPWAASGRAISQARTEGLTKVIFDKKTHRLLGAGIVGPHAGDLISEMCLAIEMGCEAEDIALTIHPHPTLAESMALAVEVFEGTATDL